LKGISFFNIINILIPKNINRESPAIAVVIALLREGAIVKIYDPKVTLVQIKNDIKENSDNVEYNGNLKNK